MSVKPSKTRRERRVQSIQEALQNFFARHKGKGNFRTAYLWENWPMVMGDPLWRLAMPLGAQDRVLVIGAEDNMLMHDLNYSAQEILNRANAFMDEEYFVKVRFELLRGRVPLYPPQSPAPGAQNSGRSGQPRPRPDNLGALMDRFDPESPIGKAYRSYVNSFDED